MEANKKILIVDDEIKIAKLLRKRLEYHNFEVYEAHDGEEGLAKTKEVKPDLIILDVMMPKMDGYTMCREVRKDLEIMKIPIIMLTAKGMGNDKLEAMDAGANGFIVKPFEPDLLLFKIKGLLGDAVIKKYPGL